MAKKYERICFTCKSYGFERKGAKKNWLYCKAKAKHFDMIDWTEDEMKLKPWRRTCQEWNK